jgi:hypothetical protein
MRCDAMRAVCCCRRHHLNAALRLLDVGLRDANGFLLLMLIEFVLHAAAACDAIVGVSGGVGGRRPVAETDIAAAKQHDSRCCKGRGNVQ